MPKAVLAGLKDLDVELSVICAMLDTGGSTGRLRKDYKILAPGDIRRAFLVLANTSPVVENLFNYRFEVGELKGHNIANLLIAALELSTNNYEQTIEVLNRLLNVRHKVLPVTLEKSELHAVLENGKVIIGETNIDKPKHNGKLRIEKIYLDPPAKAYVKAVEAIKEAELIVIGPGDIYSTLAQIFLCKGIKEAVQKSKGKTAYIVNLMTKYGETNDFSVMDFTRQIEAFLEDDLDYVIYNNKMPSQKAISGFRKKYPELLEATKLNEGLPKDKFIGADLLKNGNNVVHNPKKLAKILLSL